MTDMKCPLCGCRNFYLKDAEDEYGTHPFELKNGEIVFKEEHSAEECPNIDAGSVTYCERCTWHGEFQKLKPV
jgi:hypothetical protein